ncbi:hypothetical protein Pelo_8583 [Pelomyxa schiedti]|nr:hypothetical protein Pelo_8583 [Pelomyxa schiedti]
MKRLLGRGNWAVVAQGADAKCQFLALACGALVPRCRCTRQDTSSSSRGCFVGLLPPAVLVDILGKGWILRPERNLVITFSLRDDMTVFFSVSHTLGILVHPQPSSHSEVELGVSVMDTSSGKLTSQLLRGITVDTGFICCCNSRWIATIKWEKHDKTLSVWRVADSLPQRPKKVFNFPWTRDTGGRYSPNVEMRFYGHSLDSDVIELMLCKQRSDGSKIVRILHVDLNKAMQEGWCISNENVIAEYNNTMAIWVTLANTLVQRPQNQFYFPFSPETTTGKSILQLAHLNTGNTITWLDGKLSPCPTSRVDDSHLAITENNNAITSVFNPLSSRPSEPCFVHVHPPRTTKVVVGCGLIIADSTPRHPFINKFLGPLPTVHTITDATTGTHLVTLQHEILVPVSTYRIRIVPFSRPANS